MSVLVAQIHIDTSASTSASSRAPPATPIPLTSASTHLTPSTELRIPTSSSAAQAPKPQQLANLADAIDSTRANLNQVLTSWKDWMGKEEGAAANAQQDQADDDDEEDEEEE